MGHMSLEAREQHRLQRQRGAGARELAGVQFGFTFGSLGPQASTKLETLPDQELQVISSKCEKRKRDQRGTCTAKRLRRTNTPSVKNKENTWEAGTRPALSELTTNVQNTRGDDIKDILKDVPELLKTKPSRRGRPPKVKGLDYQCNEIEKQDEAVTSKVKGRGKGRKLNNDIDKLGQVIESEENRQEDDVRRQTGSSGARAQHADSVPPGLPTVSEGTIEAEAEKDQFDHDSLRNLSVNEVDCIGRNIEQNEQIVHTELADESKIIEHVGPRRRGRPKKVSQSSKKEVQRFDAQRTSKRAAATHPRRQKHKITTSKTLEKTPSRETEIEHKSSAPALEIYQEPTLSNLPPASSTSAKEQKIPPRKKDAASRPESTNQEPGQDLALAPPRRHSGPASAVHNSNIVSEPPQTVIVYPDREKRPKRPAQPIQTHQEEECGDGNDQERDINTTREYESETSSSLLHIRPSSKSPVARSGIFRPTSRHDRPTLNKRVDVAQCAPVQKSRATRLPSVAPRLSDHDRGIDGRDLGTIMNRVGVKVPEKLVGRGRLDGRLNFRF